jgi:hypothetical protein
MSIILMFRGSMGRANFNLFILIFTGLILVSCVSDVGPDERPSFTPFTFEEPTAPTLPTRPDGAVDIQPGFCGCRGTSPIILGDCAGFCSQKTSAPSNVDILYFEVELDEQITLNPELGDLKNWCTYQFVIQNEDGSTETSGADPDCVLVYRDNENNENVLNVNISAGSNKVTAELNESFLYDRTYVLYLMETSSGAKSDSIQVRRVSSMEDPELLSPLKIEPLNGYTCITRGYSADGNNIFYDTAFKLHYYYISSDEPPLVPAGSPDFFCHDINTYGPIDQRSFPRLELTPGIFSVWSMNDSRFYDRKIDPEIGDINGRTDIHDIIEDQMELEGNGPLLFNIFTEFSWFNFPGVNGDGSSSPTILGYTMVPWIDESTNPAYSYCPTSANYYGTNPTLRALRDVVGVDTEGLYVGVKEQEAIIIDGQIVQDVGDFILIRESLLKDIWFYFENGQHIEPSPITEGSKTMHFYWPPNTANPFIKNSDQRLYTVRHTSQLSVEAGASNPDPLMPHDKKFACIPKGGIQF